MRQAIVEYSRRLTLASPEDVVTEYEPVEAIKGLKIVDGFQCQYDECSELRGTEGSTLYSRHYRDVIMSLMPAISISDPWPKIKSECTNVCDRHVLM